jgi:hypothetical protein
MTIGLDRWVRVQRTDQRPDRTDREMHVWTRACSLIMKGVDSNLDPALKAGKEGQPPGSRFPVFPARPAANNCSRFAPLPIP